MKSFLITAAVSILFSISLIAQSIQLNSLNGPNGGSVNKFEVNHLGDIFAVQNQKGNFVSRDGGNTWESVDDDFKTTNTAVHPDGSFYGAPPGNHKFFKVPLGSTQVEEINFDSLNQSTIYDFTIDDNGVFFAVTLAREVFRSDDNASTWTYIGEVTWNANVYPSQIYAPENDDYIYFNTITNGSIRSLLYRMKKDGSEFELSFVSNSDRIYNFCKVGNSGYVFNTFRGVYFSPDGANPWSLISQGTNQLWVTCDTSGNLTTGGGDGYYRSSDLGVNWTKLTSALGNNYVGAFDMQYDAFSDRYIMRIISPNPSNFFAVNPDLSNFESILPEDNAPAIGQIFTSDFGTIFAGVSIPNNTGAEGWIRSTDFGASFQPVRTSNDTEFRFLSEGADDLLFGMGFNDTLYQSADQGMTWQINMPAGISFNPQGDGRFSYAKGSDNGIVLANFSSAFSAKLWLSENNGVSWRAISGQSYHENLIDIHPSSEDVYGLFYQNGGGKLITKYDIQTNAWDTIYNSSGSNINLQISQSGLILIRRNSDWLVSEDEGQTFQAAPWKNLIYMTSAANGYLAAVQSGNIVLSKNNGLSWEVIYEHTDRGVFRDLYFDDNNKLFAAFDGNYIHESSQIIFEDNFIVGNVWYDRNKDCAYDSSELYLKDIIVSAEGMDTFFVTTRSDGRFVIPVPAGDYDVSISLGGDLWMPCDSLQSVTLTGISDTAFIDFPVKPKIICPKLSVDISSPRFRRCFVNTYHVNYCNDGTTIADSAYVEVTLDPRMTIGTSQIPWDNSQGNTYTFQVGDLDIFSCGKFSFTVEHDCAQVDLGETICAEAKIFPDIICVPAAANWSKASLEISVECEGDSAVFKIKNVGTGNMIEARNYIIIEDFVIMRNGVPFQLDAGEELLIPVETMGQTIHLETQQVAGHPGISRPSATIEKCGVQPHSLGFFNQFGHNDANSNVDIECREAIGAYDPNDKNAVPTGRGTERLVQPDRLIEYLIRFQNTGTDTAFTVQIFDTLSQNLDVKSFDPVSSSHDFTYEIFDQGVVKFKFENIMLPDSFVNEPASNGFIKYKIAMNTGLLPAEEILNSADIYFDYNAPIRTNTTLHTIEPEWVLVEAGEVFLPKSEVKVFPNPFTESAILKLESVDFKSEFTCRIFDLNGRLISERISDNQEVTLSRKGMESGFYFYKIENQAESIASGKLIVK